MQHTSFTNWVNRSALYIALVVAWVATVGSLYFSEVAGYVPCTLCWYQRILMYPLAGFIALGLLRIDPNLPHLVIPFSVLGQIVATYHYLLQKTTLFGAPTACQTGIPCSTTWINWLGFVTIPFLAMMAFFLITIFSLVALTANEPSVDEVRTAPWAPVVGTIVAVVLVFAVLIRWSSQPEVGFVLNTLPGGDRLPLATAVPLLGAEPESGSSQQSEGIHPDGNRLYLEACAACHGPDAQGVEHLGDSLIDSEIIGSPDDTAVLDFIRKGRGLDDPLNTSGLVMPPSGGRPDLSDEQILAIVHHIRSQ